MGKTGVAVSLTILLFPALVSADCADLGRFTNSYLERAHPVIFYAGDIPLARVEIPCCEISPLSTILLLNSYVCDSDQIYGGWCRLQYHHSEGIVLEGHSCHFPGPSGAGRFK